MPDILLRYLSCRVSQAYKRSSLRIELCLWINAIYPLLQCQTSSSSLVMHLTGTQVRTLAGSQCLFSPWRYLIVKVCYHHGLPPLWNVLLPWLYGTSNILSMDWLLSRFPNRHGSQLITEAFCPFSGLPDPSNNSAKGPLVPQEERRQHSHKQQGEEGERGSTWRQTFSWTCR